MILPRHIVWFLGILFCSSTQLAAQDLHFSQYFYTPQYLSPALTGVMNEDYRISGHYRSQWQSVPVPFITFSTAFDMKFQLPSQKDSYFGAGGNFYYDEAGDANWSLSQMNLQLAYIQVLNEDYSLSGGFSLGFTQRSLDVDLLQFANQFDGESFDPTRTSRETNLNTIPFGYVDHSAGLNLKMKNDVRWSYSESIVGIGIFHINQPVQKVYNGVNSKLPIRATIYASGWVGFNEDENYLISTMGNLMGSSNEVSFGLGYRRHLNREPGKELTLGMSLHYRFIGINDALYPVFHAYYRNWRIGLSYDINMSEFKVATNGRGGPELSVTYSIYKVKPLKESRSCPIF